MRRRLFSPTLALCLAMVMAGPSPGSGQQVQPLDPEWLQKMYAEGWQKVQEGVLQRDTGEEEPETFGYGAEGLEWVLRGHQQRLVALEEGFDQAPTKRLLERIDQLKAEISRLSKVLTEAPSVDWFNDEGMTTCVPSLGGSAQATPPKETWGAEAVASAWFYNDCNHLGDTFATAYAHAIQGTVETTTTQSDPKNSGSWLDSQAIASVSGSTGCESSAQATVTSSELSIAYQTPFVQNFKCAYNSSIYTLDSTAWTQTGPGDLGPLTLSGTGYTLIDNNYAPISTSGLTQRGISMAPSGAKLTSQVIDTTATFASASFIEIEFSGRLTVAPSSGSAILAVGHHVSGTGSIYGIRISIDGFRRLTAVTLSGDAGTSFENGTPRGLTLNDTTVEAYRWVWSETSVGSSTGNGQWWRKAGGTWLSWGVNQPDMPRPLGHVNTRLHLHSDEAGAVSSAGFDYLHARITLGTR